MNQIECKICKINFTKSHGRQLTCSSVCSKLNDNLNQRLTRKRNYKYKGRNQKRENNNAYKNGIGFYTQFKKPFCEICKITEKLCVHHKDEDRTNNKEDNLQTLCRRCHALTHNVSSRLPKGEELSKYSKQVKRNKCPVTGRFIKKE